MHGILKSVHLGRTKQNKTEQMASKIENTEEKKVSYIDFKSNLQLQIRNYALNPILASFEESSHKGSSEYCTYLIDY